MPYATQAEMVSRFGERELVELTDRFDAPLGLIDAGVLGKALADADVEIDGYIGARYTLPLATVPDRLVQLACDIARYHLYTNAVPELVAERYKAAIAFLRLVAAGGATLGLPETSGSAGMGLAEISTGRRLFARGDR
ncbi:hypothetical protein dqs_0627 [Azoarcus olearius]|uniref:gp436 family protein n=1 Tax=Azoarcus sp. (strain BH72) TaxID=418699 RepID=UPI0008060ABD|nr:DUF1320 domain-containing protein [Azoarcus olearius]ANQ83703.1 hypothetical protein dqs_0627 [Azoarcus olearius]